MIESVQTGFVYQTDANGLPTGTDPFDYYIDVTIASVNTAKSICVIQGGTFTYHYGPSYQAIRTASSGYAFKPLIRLINSTTLRIYLKTSHSPIEGLTGRWTVIEYK